MNESTGHSKRILIVDDDDDLRPLLHLAVTKRAFRVTSVPDGVDALMEILRGVKEESFYAVVILDCAMPFADGFSIARAIRCLEANHVIPRRTKLGLYTAYPDLLGPSTLLEDSDIDAYVPKPDFDALYVMIDRLASEEGEKDVVAPISC